jgi:Glycosyl hydrolase 108
MIYICGCGSLRPLFLIFFMAITIGKQVTATKHVNVRKGPGISHMPIDELVPNQIVKIVGGPVQDSGLVWWQIGDGKWVAEAYANSPLIVDADDLFGRCIAFVLESEGGLSEDPNDKGGLTNFGISQRAYPKLDIRNLTRQQAELIYRADYWHASGADSQPWPLCLIVLDTAVLHGVGRAVEWLRKTQDPWAYLAIRLESYTSMQTWQHHGAGWVNRVVKLMRMCNGN